MDINEIYYGSNRDNTRQLYSLLESKGPLGIIALNLFRASKNNARAKVYRGGIPGKGSYKRMAYDRKQWSLGLLCDALSEYAEGAGIIWGWKVDTSQQVHSWVLYVDLPTGQVSFHSAQRGKGPDYPGDWDGQHQGASRILDWVKTVLGKETT